MSNSKDINMSGIHALLAALMLTSMVACNPGEPPADAIETDALDGVGDEVLLSELEKVFQRGNEKEIRDAIDRSSRIWAASANVRVYSLLLEVWSQRVDLHPTYQWELLRSSRVRIVLASNLVQAYRSQRIPLTTKEFRDFAVEQTKSTQRDVAGPALILLGQIGEANDIPFIESRAVTHDQSPAFFQESVLALNYICSASALQAMERLRDAAEGEKREFAEAAISSRANYVESLCR